MVPSGRTVNHSGCATQGWSGAALQGEVQRHLHAQVAGAVDERVEVRPGCPVRGGRRVVPAVGRADRPRRAHVAGGSGSGIDARCWALAVHRADGVDRRQVDHVEAHRGDPVQLLAAVTKVPCTGRPASSRPPVERGKNSYQDPNSARGRSTYTCCGRPRVISSRTGRSAMIAWTAGRGRGRRAPAAAATCRAARSPRRTAGRGWARSAGRRPTRCSSRAPTSRSLASSSGPCPALSLTVTACRQVAHGSLQASTRKVHSPGSSGHDRRGEAVDVVARRGHPDVHARPVAADLLPDDVRGDRVVALAPDRRADRDDLADDRLAGMVPVAHGRRDVVDTQPTGHQRTPWQILVCTGRPYLPVPDGSGSPGSRWPGHDYMIFTWVVRGASRAGDAASDPAGF